MSWGTPDNGDFPKVNRDVSRMLYVSDGMECRIHVSKGLRMFFLQRKATTLLSDPSPIIGYACH